VFLKASPPGDSDDYLDVEPVVHSVLEGDDGEDLSYLDDEQRDALAKIQAVIAEQDAVYAEIRRLRSSGLDLVDGPGDGTDDGRGYGGGSDLPSDSAAAAAVDVPFDELVQATDDDDPYSGLTYAEIVRLEQEAVEARLGGEAAGGLWPSTKKNHDPPGAHAAPPAARQCRRYRFAQDEDWVTIEVPLPRAASKSDVQMAVGPDSFQVSMKNAKELSLISGSLQGPVDPQSVAFEVVAAPKPGSAASLRGCQDPILKVRVQKKPAAGTVDMWYGLLAGEEPASTVRFAWAQPADQVSVSGSSSRSSRSSSSSSSSNNSGEFSSIDSSNDDNSLPARPVRRVAYTWKQAKDALTLTLDLGSGCLAGLGDGGAAVSKKDVQLAVAKDGRSLQVAVKGEMLVAGKLWGVVRPQDSTWFLVSDEDASRATVDVDSGGQAAARKMVLEVELMKRVAPANNRDDATDSFTDPWWPSLLLGEDEETAH
jgi:hypothetical protein